ncbi:hypothetical protein [Oribacterium sp. FC2011]|uniref:hypothetical protein n=1 Tax=Oribacterium sp. FC2011 TaxID=1408311 RepID=UPI0004E20AFD|nr:hypothetical protein [Oribacterium sp. FC2011]
MAKFKEYKNGIVGKRHGIYYVVSGDGVSFDIIDKEKNLIESGFASVGDAEWRIEKITADDELLKYIDDASQMTIGQLTGKMMEIFNTWDGKVMPKEEKRKLSIVETIRNRKAKKMAI